MARQPPSAKNSASVRLAVSWLVAKLIDLSRVLRSQIFPTLTNWTTWTP